MTRRRIILPLAALFTGAALVSACGGEQAGDQPTSLEQQQQQQESPVAKVAPQVKVAPSTAHLPRPMRALLKDLYSLEGLTTAQTSRLDALQVKIRAQTATWRNMHAAALEDAAKQVRAGQLEQASIEAHVTKMVEAMKDKARPLIVASLDELHRTLSADQRRALVAKLKARHEARDPRAKMRKLADKLSLDDTQRQQIRSVLMSQFGDKMLSRAKHRAEHQARMKAAAEAFIRDDFQASELPFAKAPKKNLADIKLKIAGARGFFNSLLPILSNAQREVIATLLEQKAAKARLAAQLE